MSKCVAQGHNGSLHGQCEKNEGGGLASRKLDSRKCGRDARLGSDRVDK